MFWCAVQPNQICHWLLSRPHTNQFGDPPCRMRTSRTSVNLLSSKSWIKVKTDQKQDGIFHKPHDKWYNSLQTPNNQGPVIHCSLRICGWWRRMLIWESWTPPTHFLSNKPSQTCLKLYITQANKRTPDKNTRPDCCLFVFKNICPPPSQACSSRLNTLPPGAAETTALCKFYFTMRIESYGEGIANQALVKKTFGVYTRKFSFSPLRRRTCHVKSQADFNWHC